MTHNAQRLGKPMKKLTNQLAIAGLLCLAVFRRL